jgi:hypothetical protein
VRGSGGGGVLSLGKGEHREWRSVALLYYSSSSGATAGWQLQLVRWACARKSVCEDAGVCSTRGGSRCISKPTCAAMTYVCLFGGGRVVVLLGDGLT